jgi:hypothetical protein
MWALWVLQISASLIVLHTNKGNATVILNTNSYMQNISALFGAHACSRWLMSPWNWRPDFLSRNYHFLRRLPNKYYHRILAPLHCMGCQRFYLGQLWAPSGPPPPSMTLPTVWQICLEDTWGTTCHMKNLVRFLHIISSVVALGTSLLALMLLCFWPRYHWRGLAPLECTFC